MLRDCLPASVQRTLTELPESLDETYERILKEIKKPNRDLAQRVLQCLVVATRPLSVAELGEVLAVDFDSAEGIPKLNPDWRWEDQEEALLIACSSLIAIVEIGDVNTGDSNLDAGAYDVTSELSVEASDHDSDHDVEAGVSRIVQFSHFSVKEFLTSSRLATAGGEVSNFHINLGPAHIILAQACLGILLQMQNNVEAHTHEIHPLARYAAEHWTTHAQSGGVPSRLRRAMEYLFDLDKPYFNAWLTIYDIDTFPTSYLTFGVFALRDKSLASPLYYAALCGFHDLVEHLITKNLQVVNADGGHYARPLVAALAGEHFQTADLLHRNGAHPHVRRSFGCSPLHAAAFSGNLEVVRILIEYDADVNARDVDGYTPLYVASERENLQGGSVLRLLLEHGADINARTNSGRTALHRASSFGILEAVRLLLENGVDVEAKNIDGETALQEAAKRGRVEVVKLLRERGAK